MPKSKEQQKGSSGTMDTRPRPSAAQKNSSDVWQDDIVEEIHEHRARLAERFNYDLDKLLEYYREGEERNPGRRADSSPARPAPEKTA